MYRDTSVHTDAGFDWSMKVYPPPHMYRPKRGCLGIDRLYVHEDSSCNLYKITRGECRKTLGVHLSRDR